MLAFVSSHRQYTGWFLAPVRLPSLGLHSPRPRSSPRGKGQKPKAQSPQALDREVGDREHSPGISHGDFGYAAQRLCERKDKSHFTLGKSCFSSTCLVLVEVLLPTLSPTISLCVCWRVAGILGKGQVG